MDTETQATTEASTAEANTPQFNWVYAGGVLVAAVIVGRFMESAAVILWTAVFYGLCFACLKIFSPGINSIGGRVATTTTEYFKEAVARGRTSFTQGGFKRFGRFLLLPSSKRGLGFPGLFIFCSLVLAIIAFLTGTDPSSRNDLHTKFSEEVLQEKLQNQFTRDKQGIFDIIHPTGTAKSVKVHEVSIKWKNDVCTNNEKDMQQFTVRYTIYWEGRFEKNGFTQATQTYDAEIGRWVGGKVLQTNGVTKNDLTEFGVDVGVEVLKNWLNGD